MSSSYTFDNLPFELHLPDHQYCGHGTKLQEHLSRGDRGINGLDQACKEHDTSYSKFINLSDRHIADKILAEKAWQRVKAKHSSISERLNAYMMTNMMKGKVKLGMGLKKKTNKRTSVKKKMKKIVSLGKTIQVLVSTKHTAKKTFKKKMNNIKQYRVISLPKSGGAIPFLLPLFAGLSAL